MKITALRLALRLSLRRGLSATTGVILAPTTTVNVLGSCDVRSVDARHGHWAPVEVDVSH